MALRASPGYTLSEIMVTVAIIGMLTATASPLLVNMVNFWRQTTARASIQRDVRASLDTINRFARQAQSNTVAVDRLAGQPPFSRLTFTIIQGQTVSFYQQGNRLFMRRGSNVSLLASNIAYIAFAFPRTDDVTLLTVAITAQSATFLGGSKALQLSIQKVRIMN